MNGKDLVLRRAIEVAHHLNDPTPPWHDVLTTTREVVGSDWAMMTMFDPSGSLLEARSVGVPDSVLSEYAERYYELDPMARYMRGIQPGTWFDTELGFTAKQRSGSEFFGHWGAKHRFAQISAFFFGTPQVHAAISFQRSRADPGALERLARPGPARLFRTLQVELSRRQNAAAAKLQVAEEVLAQFGEATCLLSAGGSPLHVSARATELLAQAGITTKRGKLWHADQRLLRFVFDRLRLADARPETVSLSLPAGWGSQIRLDLSRASQQMKIASEPLVLMRVSRATVFIERDEERLRMAFGLSPAEARVLAGLLGGGRVADLAIAGEVSEETVRRQIKTTMAKMQCTSQAELVKLAMLAMD